MKLTLSQQQEIHAWPPAMRDKYEERAAIIQYDAGYSRDEAEARAYALVKARNAKRESK